MEKTKPLKQLKEELFPNLTPTEFNDLLWNATCFPMDSEETVKQLEELAEKIKQGKTVDQLIGESEEEILKIISSLSEK